MPASSTRCTHSGTLLGSEAAAPSKKSSWLLQLLFLTADILNAPDVSAGWPLPSRTCEWDFWVLIPILRPVEGRYLTDTGQIPLYLNKVGDPERQPKA